jgi:pimeloyl-ACP methyl ester carboxylesterase
MNMPTGATYGTDGDAREEIEREVRCLRVDERSPRASLDAARLDRRGDPLAKSIIVRGVAVAFVDQGEGEPVMLLHCSGSSSAQWRALIDTLGAHYRVIAPDLFGYGATPLWPGHAPFSLGHEAEIVLALIGMLGEPAHLVGHSYGGVVALHVALERPDLLRSLCVIEPVAFHLLDGEPRAEIEAVAQGVESALSSGDYLNGFGRFVDYWSGPGAWNKMPEAKRAPMAARLAKVALDFHAIFSEPAQCADFEDVAVPTLVVQGGRTRLPTQRICERLADTLPEARSATVPAAGHMLPITHRDEVNRLIAAHLDTNAVPSEEAKH